MKDYPSRPLTQEERKDILVEAMIACREKDCAELFMEIEEKIRERGIKPDIETIKLILDE